MFVKPFLLVELLVELSSLSIKLSIRNLKQYHYRYKEMKIHSGIIVQSPGITIVNMFYSRNSELKLVEKEERTS